jgi:hypothetical protein
MSVMDLEDELCSDSRTALGRLKEASHWLMENASTVFESNAGEAAPEEVEESASAPVGVTAPEARVTKRADSKKSLKKGGRCCIRL